MNSLDGCSSLRTHMHGACLLRYLHLMYSVLASELRLLCYNCRQIKEAYITDNDNYTLEPLYVHAYIAQVTNAQCPPLRRHLTLITSYHSFNPNAREVGQNPGNTRYPLAATPVRGPPAGSAAWMLHHPKVYLSSIIIRASDRCMGNRNSAISLNDMVLYHW